MYSPDMEFMDVVDRYVNSGRKTGLAILIGLPPAFSVVEENIKYI